MVFVFGSAYVKGCVYRFAYVDPALYRWGKANLIVMGKLFDVLLDLVCQYFIEDFLINVHHEYWPEILFFSCVLARFWHHDDVGLINYFRRIPSFWIIWNSFRRNINSSSLCVW